MGKNMKSGIYEIVNRLNGKKYVGSSHDVEKRILTHKSKLRCNTHVNKHLQNSYNKHGVDNFDFNIIEICPIDDLTDRETHHLSLVKESYNIREVVDSNLGLKMSEETKRKISEANRGKKLTDEHKKRLSEALKNKPMSSESILKMKNTLTGRKLTEEHKKNISKNHANRGKTLSEETKKKISENHKKNNIKPPSRKGVKVEYKPRPKMKGKFSGKNNPMYGKSVKDVWIEKYGKEEAERMWCSKYPKKCNN
jgi:group I intron endonuclease